MEVWQIPGKVSVIKKRRHSADVALNQVYYNVDVGKRSHVFVEIPLLIILFPLQFDSKYSSGIFLNTALSPIQ